MLIEIKGTVMRLVSKSKMPENKYNQETKQWDRTGNYVDFFEYTFRDDLKEVLVLNSRADFSELEDQKVKVTVSIENDRFARGKIKVVLADVEKAK